MRVNPSLDGQREKADAAEIPLVEFQMPLSLTAGIVI
jgi:hypothetical protein